MKEEKIFVTDNPLMESELKHNVMATFDQCGKLEALLYDFGFPITREIVTDCLTLHKEVVSIPIEGRVKWVGENDVRFAKEYAPTEEWRNDEHLQAERKRIENDIVANDERPADREAKINALMTDYDKLLGKIYGLFHIQKHTIETSDFLRYFEIADGHIILPKDFDERLKADCATYAETKQGKAACHLHREAAGTLNRLAGMLKSVARYEFVTGLDRLFYQSEDGTILAAPIDYDLFTQ